MTLRPLPSPKIAPTQPRRADRIPDEEWAKWRDLILKFYLEEDGSLNDTVDIMKREHGFAITVKQLKHRLELWGIWKYIPSSDLKIMVALKRKRLEEGKDTKLQYRGVDVEQGRLDRAYRRMKDEVTSPTMIPTYIKLLPTPPYSRTYTVSPPPESHVNAGNLLAPTWADPLHLLEGSHVAAPNRVVGLCVGPDSFAPIETTTRHTVTSGGGNSKAYSDSTNERMNSCNDAVKATSSQIGNSPFQELTRETGKSAEASVPALTTQQSSVLANWFLDDAWLDEILSPTDVFSKDNFTAHQNTLCEEQPPYVDTSLQVSVTYPSGNSFSAENNPYHTIDLVRYRDQSPRACKQLAEITQPLMLLRYILFKELKWDPCQTLVDCDWLRCEIDKVLVKCHDASAQAIKRRLEGSWVWDPEPRPSTSPTTHRNWARLPPAQGNMTQRRSVYWFTKLPKGHVKFRFSGRRDAADGFGGSSVHSPLSGRVAFTPGPEICMTGVSVRYTRPSNVMVECPPLCPFNTMP